MRGELTATQSIMRIVTDNSQRLKLNPLSANPIKWLNTLKQFVSKLPMNYLSVFDHFDGLVLKRLSLFTVL